MNYTTKYNRAQLTVVHPQLNQPYYEFKAGKKLFIHNKNIETSGHDASYGLPQLASSKSPSDKSFSPERIRIKEPGSSREPAPHFRPKQSREVQVAAHDFSEVDLAEPSQKSINDLSAGPNSNQIHHKNLSPENPNQVAREEASNIIQQIKDQIRQREEEINKIKKISTKNEQEVFNRIDKLRWDKQSEAEKREINKNLLDEQVFMKNQLKRIEEVEKEKERNERLKQIMQFRNEQELERQENLKKVSQYYKELSVQHEIKKQIQEIENKQYWESIPRPKENPPPGKIWNGSSRSNEGSPTTGHDSRAKMFYFSKKQPKNLVFNAITGELKDFSGFEQKSFSYLAGRNLSPVQDRNLIKGAGNYIVGRKMSPN